MKCPVCGAVYRPAKVNTTAQENINSNSLPIPPSSPICRRCKADLSDLIRLHDQAIWYHRKALHLLQQGHYLEAEANNNQALALDHSNADFHALAGKLSALQGNFREAIASWQQALKFDPENAIARGCLPMMVVLPKIGVKSQCNTASP